MRILKLLFTSLLFFLLIPVASYSVELEFSLPDSLSELNHWDGVGKVTCPPENPYIEIPNLVVRPETGDMGLTESFDIMFDLPSTGIPNPGGFSFRFPSQFNLDSIYDIEYADNYSGADPELWVAFIFNQQILIFFEPSDSPPEGTEVTITIRSIGNPLTAGSYQISALIFKRYFKIAAGPTSSEFFEIHPGTPVSLEIEPSNDSMINLGESILFRAYGVDQFGNVINDMDIVWSLSEDYDNIGILTDGFLYANRPGTGKVIAESGLLTVESGLITVAGEPSFLDSLSLIIDETQFAGYPLREKSTITAFDQYGNIFRNISEMSTITFNLVADSGSFSPNVLSNTDFVDGVCDLSDKNIMYDGGPGEIELYVEAVNLSGDKIVSNTINMFYNGLAIDYFQADTIIFKGDYLRFSVLFRPLGNILPTNGILAQGQLASCSSCFQSWLYTPGMLNEIISVDLALPTDSAISGLTDSLQVALTGYYQFDEDSIPINIELKAPVRIYDVPVLQYIENSLSLDSIILPAFMDTISLQFEINANSSFGNIIHVSVSKLYVYPDESYNYPQILDMKTYSLELTGNVVDLSYFETSFSRLEQVPNLQAGYKSLMFKTSIYFENGLRYQTELDKFDSLYVGFQSDIEYVEGSLAPRTVFNDTAYSFEVKINLLGNTTYSLDPFASRLELHFEGGLLAGYMGDYYNMTSGENTIATSQIYIPSMLIGKELSPRLILAGNEFGTSRTDTILFGDETIMVDRKTDVDPSDAEIYIIGDELPDPLVKEGTTVEPFVFSLTNPVTGTEDIAGFQSAIITVRDRYDNIVSPDDILVLEESGIYFNNNLVTQSDILDDRLRLRLNNFVLPNNMVSTFVFKVLLKDEILLEGFNISLDSRDIHTMFIAGQYNNQTIPVVGDSSGILLLEADLVIIKSGLEKSLMIKNNPFNPYDGPAEIAYELNENTGVDLTIYTLTGEKVYETSFRAGGNGGSMGINIVTWTGENDEDRMVLNGVYVAVIAPHNTDKTYKLKIAVMK
ncbi:MAG: hypothetical protein ABIJ45_01440 [Candidatus Zixiibacteriota bacterium]